MNLRTTLAALVTLLLASSAFAQSLPTVAPEDAGLSTERLKRLEAVAQKIVGEEKAAAGVVVLIARHGGLAYHAAFGAQDVEAKLPMRKDSIFRICSMSKPITSVAAMILFEEGAFLLDDPVEKFLPEFKDQKVLAQEQPAGATEPATVPAARPITIRDLLTHTSGIVYRFFAPPPLDTLYTKGGVVDGLHEADIDLAENVRRIAAQPLLHQPGAKWTYGLNTDVLGRVIEVIAKKPLGEFLEERVFRPLHMSDSGFVVPNEKLDRLTRCYRADLGAGLHVMPDGPVTIGNLVFSASYPYRGKTLQSGGGGMVSTAMDYARFAEMVLGGGDLDGARLLSRKTIELMTANHVSTIPEAAAGQFGLGFSIAQDPGKSGTILSEGAWGWDGFYSTRFWIDPEEEMVGVILTQTYPYGASRAIDRLQALAIQAIAD